jgi:lysophospholipase L1-like esterase
VSLLVGEAGVRLLTRTPPALLVTDPVVGKRFLPDYASRVFVPECGCEVDLRFNREGLRGPERPYAKPPGVKRIALVGDSMVAAVATAEERTLASRLERMLAASRPEARWEVINAGVSSSSTASELALYRAVLDRYAPDLVVLLFWVGNDLADNSDELTHAPRLYFDLDAQGRLRQLPFALQSSPVANWLDRWSRLYVWQKTAVRQARARWIASSGSLEPTELVFAEPEPAAVARAWTITGALLRAFREETAARGQAFTLVEATAAAQVYDDLWSELDARARGEKTPLAREHPEERLLALSREAGIPFLALTTAFRAAAPARDSQRADEQLYYAGRFHWNDKGNELAAKTIHEFLLTVVQSSP